MSIPALITAPNSCASGIVMTMTTIVGATESPFTLQDQRFLWPGERWNIDFTMPPMTQRADAAEWQSFLLKLKGTFNVFLIGDPSGKTPRGVATGSPQIDGNNQTGATVLTKGWTTGVTGILRKGDYIQIGTGLQSRLHMVVEDANSDGSGNAPLSIVPDLRFSPVNNTPIAVSNAKGVFRLAQNDVSWSVGSGSVYRIQFSAIEVVNA